MKRRKVDSQLERQFLIGLITSTPFLASAAPVFDIDLVQTEYVKQVARWCIDFWNQHNEAPGKNLQTVFHAWVEAEERDDTQVALIEELLGSLSDQSDQDGQLNVAYLLDQLSTYLSMRKLTVLNERLGLYLERGDKDAAVQEVGEFKSVELGQGCGFDPLNDRAAWTRTFSDPAEPLIKFPGDAGRFLNRALTRDSLVGIQGPEKRGKTFWCMEFVMRALRSRRRVALFEVGDLSESQIMMRLGVRLTSLPLWKDQVGKISVPIGITKLEDGEKVDGVAVQIETEEKDCPRTVNRRACLRACRGFMRSCGIDQGDPHLMISIHPNSSINVKGIEGILERWEHEQGFVPDVVVIDYADILLPETDRHDVRHQVNDTWMALRRVSQERHCLVISPTQASKASYSADVQRMEHSTEDKRKNAHVTGMLGLNQTMEEKKARVMRLNWTVLRESDFLTEQCLWVAQCFPLARAFCCAIV